MGKINHDQARAILGARLLADLLGWLERAGLIGIADPSNDEFWAEYPPERIVMILEREGIPIHSPAQNFDLERLMQSVSFRGLLFNTIFKDAVDFLEKLKSVPGAEWLCDQGACLIPEFEPLPTLPRGAGMEDRRRARAILRARAIKEIGSAAAEEKERLFTQKITLWSYVLHWWELKLLSADRAMPLAESNPVGKLQARNPGCVPPKPKTSTQRRKEAKAAVRECGGNKSEAARRLGISRGELYRRLEN